MNRFDSRRKRNLPWKSAISPAASILILFLFLSSVSSVSENTAKEQKKNLEEAVRRNIIQCYITEGSYPESLDYLLEHYPILYDSDAYKIIYHPIGENIMPDVTVLSIAP